MLLHAVLGQGDAIVCDCVLLCHYSAGIEMTFAV